jgi:F0F1-type ATP synthase membrane subunit b/b'
MLVRACENRINLVVRLVVVAGALCLFPLPLAAEPMGSKQAGEAAPSHGRPSQHGEATGQATGNGKGEAGHAGEATSAPQHGEAHSEEAGHGESAWRPIAMLVNFLLLAGGLYYFLRTPLAGHLAGRAGGIRSALAEAESTRQAASAQLTEVEAKLQALPREIETLRQRGVEEIASEEARIRQATEEERQRMVTQARREIDLALRVAKQELVAHAASLAVDVASSHLRATMTQADQERLIARYVADVRQPHD